MERSVSPSLVIADRDQAWSGEQLTGKDALVQAARDFPASNTKTCKHTNTDANCTNGNDEDQLTLGPRASSCAKSSKAYNENVLTRWLFSTSSNSNLKLTKSRPLPEHSTENAVSNDYESGDDSDGMNVAADAHFEACPRSPRSRRAEKEGHTRKQAYENRGYGCIYIIRRRSTGKCYIGLTERRFRQRINGHKNKAQRKKRKRKDKGCRKLHNAIRKHGWGAFDARVLYAEVPTAMLPAMEITAIAMHGTLTPGGYNLTPGGETSPMLNPIVRARAREVMQSEEVRAKREAVFSSDEFKAKVGKESKALWEGYTVEDRNARALATWAAQMPNKLAKREAKIAGMAPCKAKAFWTSAKKQAIRRARNRLRDFPERYVGRNFIAELENWWGASFETRRKA